MTAPLPDNIASRIDATGDCWEWTGQKTSNGYGLIEHWSNGQRTGRTRAHRYVYATLVGDIPDGLTIDHLCRNKLCVNPEHLEPVTQRVNARRASPSYPPDYNAEREYPIKHGTVHAFTAHKCRCQQCETAHARYQIDYWTRRLNDATRDPDTNDTATESPADH